MNSQNQPSPPKQMHGCLTAYLVLMLLSNLGTAIFGMVSLGGSTAPRLPHQLILMMVLMALLNFVFTIALFKWKKWGFFGFIGVSIVSFALNIYLGTGLMSLLGLSGIPILYWILHIGKERAAWSQLE
jgi:hypothetical protein